MGIPVRQQTLERSKIINQWALGCIERMRSLLPDQLLHHLSLETSVYQIGPDYADRVLFPAFEIEMTQHESCIAQAAAYL